MTIPPKTFDRDLNDSAWSFSTDHYDFALFIEEEDSDPADSFEFEDDISAVRNGDVEWFCAFLAVYRDGELIDYDCLGGCAYKTVREFYSSHRWQYSRRQRRWITDPKSLAWKACNARRPRRPDGSRADGTYFVDMVRTAIRLARAQQLRNTMVDA